MNPLACVSIRTAPSDMRCADIVEIAVARTEAFDAYPADVFTARVRSVHGESETGMWLVDAMDRVRTLTAGCMLVAFDAAKVAATLHSVAECWDLVPLELAPETIDMRSLAWPAVLTGEAISARLEDLCAGLGVEYRKGLCALEEVRVLGELYRRVHRRFEHTVRMAKLADDERAIVETILRRIDEGRRVYGPWKVDDGRQYPQEALAEVMDALNYCAAELVRLSKRGAA